VNEWIEVCHVDAREGAAHWETFSLKTLRSGGDALDAANLGFGIGAHARQDGEIANCYRWHDIFSSLVVTSLENLMRVPEERMDHASEDH
jgi:hypothetical protein